MLKLKNITKTYISGDEKVDALKGIDIEFRESEFVSILGQSGCGKTTLLNIIGGLDRYTKGDLVINGKSTKDFKDRDWDAYRNYSVGFVFQSYNLISHQTILSNVELALTISGVSKKERKQRAIKALEDVGLKEHIHKKPNQLSGGQMQRVAIARALVNNPDIILADEPTGALDTKTSVQVMEILKKISKNKLIIMVTHNPELAEKYSSRIIKILDGKITDDSNPIKDEDKKEEKISRDEKQKRTSMKFFTALRLSLNNLMTKKGRTILTSFAGSIGIIGIALILAISTGVQNYINKVEEDTLSSYPITIEESTIDIGSMMESMMVTEENNENKDDEKVYSADVMNEMITTLSNKKESNNLTELKKYIESGDNEIKNNSNSISYGYDLNINLYKENTDNGIVRVNPSTVMDSFGMGEMIDAKNSSSITSMFGSSMMTNTDIWIEMLDNQELLQSQYDLVKGAWPKEYNEVVLILKEDGRIDDYTLYSLGLKDQQELKDKWKAVENGESIEENAEETSYTYDELLNLKFKLLLNSDYYKKENGLWINQEDNDDFMKEQIKNAETIKIVGIIKQNEQSVASTAVTSGIGYTKQLKEHVINKSNEAEIVKEQKENKETNVFSGLKFPTEEEKENYTMGNLTAEQKMAMSKLSSEEIAKMMETYTSNKDASYEKNLQTLGAVDIDTPTSISIYPKDFESKDKIAAAIEEYNQKQRDEGKEENIINYSDLVGTMMKSVSQIINTISYVLIAFVAISLIVSSIMIGIITYISVLERTKEIGILRSIGASKKDISRVFNAETLIVGLISGLIGIGITVLLTIPINSLILAVTGVKVVTSVPFAAGVTLVLISMFLTIIAGLIPAKIASKKDPVIALRTE
ncbi:MAG: ATP-binding cassette domain-containing protein [Clostridia bacterium]|nr:ATP-binding cassette domain-containing protein [Clostridia bacterium]